MLIEQKLLQYILPDQKSARRKANRSKVVLPKELVTMSLGQLLPSLRPI